MNQKKIAARMVVCGFFALLPAVMAAPTSLPLRLESTCIFNGSSYLTVETNYGPALSALLFSGTTNYHFYSPRLTSAVTLATTDHASGTIYMANTGVSATNDFTVVGRMFFYDNDPASGLDTLLADTGNSPNVVIKHGGAATSILTPKVNLPANKTVTIGHLLHIAVTITLISGKPGNFGQFLYNGPAVAGTAAQLPENRALAWHFGVPTTRLCLSRTTSGCALLSCPATPGKTYTVQVTATLIAPRWTNLTSVTASANGLCSFTDAQATNNPCRFYRLTGP